MPKKEYSKPTFQLISPEQFVDKFFAGVDQEAEDRHSEIESNKIVAANPRAQGKAAH